MVRKRWNKICKKLNIKAISTIILSYKIDNNDTCIIIYQTVSLKNKISSDKKKKKMIGKKRN